jgi:hypothetical protein
MTTCLDINACPNDKMYNVLCNFKYGIDEYACNPKTTCMRADGKYDCCGKNIVTCVVDAASLRVPTIQPTISVNDIPCDEQCKPEYRIDTCHWYESKQINIICNDENDNYCCSQHRSDCCKTNTTDAYIVFGCIAGIMVLFAFYRYAIRINTKIIPSKPEATTTTVPPAKYQLAVFV